MFSRLVILIFILITNQYVVYKANATHIKAGEITARLVGNSTLEFTMVLYLKIEALNVAPELIRDAESAEFVFYNANIPSVKVPYSSIVDINSETRRYIYKGTVRNIPSGLSNIKISFRNPNRNANILNMSNSDTQAFYIETTFSTSQSSNTLPELTIPPIDEGAVGVPYTHNPGAIDVNGDSLSFSLVTPQSGNAVPIIGYRAPDLVEPGQSVGGGAAFSRINPVTGDFTWDSPVKEGLYNFAILITEWRRRPDGTYTRLSTIVRDMQINIKENRNRRPEIILPKDTCIEVALGKQIKLPIKAFDPDSIKPNNYQNIFLKAFTLPDGVSFELTNPIRNDLIANPGQGILTWDVGCDAVRRLPYNITFQAKDEVVLSRQLVNYKTIQFKVNGPRPENLAVLRQPNGYKLRWDKYPCPNGDSIIIYRNDCDTAKYNPDACATSVPSNFVKIAAVGINDTIYLDNKNIEQGNQYNYVLGVRFGGSKQGLSVYSEAVSVCSYFYEPITTQVSVIKTDANKGKMSIRWLKPKANLNGNYSYTLSRKENIPNANFIEIYSTNNLSDTSYVDSLPSLNTKDKQWAYQLLLKKDQNLEASTLLSSSVFLMGKPANRSIALSWQYNTAWDNSKFKHIIYRKRKTEKEFIVLDSVDNSENGGKYIDSGLDKDDTLCYYIATRGKYCSDSLPSPLVNFSQIICLSPSDSTKPCTPKLSLVDENCDLPLDSLIKKPYQNFLSWIYDDTSNIDCKTILLGFNLYKAPDQESEFKFYKFLAPNQRNYVDNDFESRAACYSISAVSESNIEGDRSNIECNDNCVFYALPNLITPNGDSLNDAFAPLNFPVGVKSVKLYIYNRWGALVHYQEGDPQLNWNPYKTSPNFSDGVYYYYALLAYERRQNPSQNKDSLKGWLHVLAKPEAKRE